MNEQYIDTIHRYLNGQMSIAERKTFETAMKNDPILSNDVDLERALLAGLEKSGEAKVRKTIGTVHQNLKLQGFFETPVLPINTLTSKPFEMKKLLAAAAVLILAVAGVWFFQNQPSGPDPDAVFAQHFDKQHDLIRARDVIASLESYGLAGVPSETDSLKAALEQYEAGNDEEALALFKAYAEAHPENDVAQYYMGVIHMGKEHYAKAIELLLPVSRSDTSDLKNDALWNLGLCYLKTINGTDDARDAFQQLSADASYPNHREAQAVLDQLMPKK